MPLEEIREMLEVVASKRTMLTKPELGKGVNKNKLIEIFNRNLQNSQTHGLIFVKIKRCPPFFWKKLLFFQGFYKG